KEGHRDLEVRRCEGDLIGALRLGAEEADVARRALYGVEQLAGAVELHELEREPRAARELAAEIRRDAARLTVGVVAEHQEEVRIVEADSQAARGCQCGRELVRHGLAA